MTSRNGSSHLPFGVGCSCEQLTTRLGAPPKLPPPPPLFGGHDDADGQLARLAFNSLESQLSQLFAGSRRGNDNLDAFLNSNALKCKSLVGWKNNSLSVVKSVATSVLTAPALTSLSSLENRTTSETPGIVSSTLSPQSSSSTSQLFDVTFIVILALIAFLLVFIAFSFLFVYLTKSKLKGSKAAADNSFNNNNNDASRFDDVAKISRPVGEKHDDSFTILSRFACTKRPKEQSSNSSISSKSSATFHSSPSPASTPLSSSPKSNSNNNHHHHHDHLNAHLASNGQNFSCSCIGLGNGLESCFHQLAAESDEMTSRSVLTNPQLSQALLSTMSRHLNTSSQANLIAAAVKQNPSLLPQIVQQISSVDAAQCMDDVHNQHPLSLVKTLSRAHNHANAAGFNSHAKNLLVSSSCNSNSPSSSVSFGSSSPSSDKSSDVKSLIHNDHSQQQQLRSYTNQFTMQPSARCVPAIFRPTPAQLQHSQQQSSNQMPPNHHYESIGDLSQFYFDVDDVAMDNRNGAHLIRPQHQPTGKPLNSFNRPHDAHQQQLILAPISYMMPPGTGTMCAGKAPPPVPRHFHSSSNCLLDSQFEGQYRPQPAPSQQHPNLHAVDHRINMMTSNVATSSTSSISNTDASRNFYLKSLIV